MRLTQSYLVELINERKVSNEKGGRRDLLSNLVDANEEVLDDGEQRLGEEELIGKVFGTRSSDPHFDNPSRSGNIFIFYLAGYEVRTFSHRELHLDLNYAEDIWTYHLFRLEHARGAPRRARNVIPTHSRDPPRWTPTSKHARLLPLEVPGLITFLDF
jgi:hypothetical protein